MTNNPTDTNQASEDALLSANELYEAEYKLQNCIRITLNVETYETEVYTGERWVAVAAYVEKLIRTEKLKLLAVVRERVVGEVTQFEMSSQDVKFDSDEVYTIAYGHAKIVEHEQLESLNKLEAEL